MNELQKFDLSKTTAEIIILKEQTAQNIVEIGKRLIEVKGNLQHGEFGKWLESKVDISIRTAQKFMKVAEEFSNTNAGTHLGSRKLFLLAGLDEEQREEVMQENNVEDMTTRELEAVIKEKKNIEARLKQEEEYSQELQEALKQKDKQISELKNIEPKVVEKEVVPDNVKQKLNYLKKLEAERQELLEKLDKAESTIKNIKLDKDIEENSNYKSTNLDLLLVNIKDFLDRASKYTYLKEELQNIPSPKRRVVERGVTSIKEWVMLMEQALEGNQDVVGNIIYGEGEIINE